MEASQGLLDKVALTLEQLLQQGLGSIRLGCPLLDLVLSAGLLAASKSAILACWSQAEESSSGHQIMVNEAPSNSKYW